MSSAHGRFHLLYHSVKANKGLHTVLLTVAGKTHTGTSAHLDDTVPSFHSTHNYYFVAQNCCNMTASLHNLCILSSFFSKAREDNCHLLYNTAERLRTGLRAMAFPICTFSRLQVRWGREQQQAWWGFLSCLNSVTSARGRKDFVQPIRVESFSKKGWREDSWEPSTSAAMNRVRQNLQLCGSRYWTRRGNVGTQNFHLLPLKPMETLSVGLAGHWSWWWFVSGGFPVEIREKGRCGHAHRVVKSCRVNCCSFTPWKVPKPGIITHTHHFWYRILLKSGWCDAVWQHGRKKWNF